MQYLNFLKKNWVVLVIFSVLVLIIYGQSLSGDFVYDDRGIIGNAEVLSNIGHVEDIFMHPYWEAENGLYRPMTLLSYSFNFIIFGQSPFSFHLVNLILYIFICFFIYLLIKKLFKQELFAFLSAILFLVLPIHTEVVANITGRSELLALFFGLLAMLEFSKEKINFYWLGLWSFMAVGGKETGVAIVPIIFLMLYHKENKINLEIIKKYFKEISAVIISTGFYFFLRFFSLGTDNFLNIKTSLVENPLLFTDTFSRFATSLKILWMYFHKTFWPVNLCNDYSFNQIPIIHNWLNFGTILGLLIIALSMFLIIKYFKKNPTLSLGATIFLFAFLPVSNLFFPIGTVAGERLFFFPTLGIVILTAFLIYKIYISIKKENTKTIYLISIAILFLVYGILSLNRQSVWTTEEKLFLSGAKCAPNSVLSRSNEGAMYLLKGDLNKAEEILLVSMNMKPIYSKGINNLGLVYAKKGDYKKAKEMYLLALKQEYPYSGAIENLISLYLNTGKIENAKHWLMIMYPYDEATIDASIKNYLEQNRK
ncbi:MAG: glycosyltransferase family 39 protein [Candidatus Parcubacteria bacterium]|nr:glycosyltransferase family 39 protein [Candidatus Parcubacteria bacterium]